MFLKILQNSQENTCVYNIFPCEFCEIFKNTFFLRTSPIAASVFFKTPLYDCSWWIYSAVKVVKEQPRSKGYSATVLEKYVLTPVSTIYFPVSFAKFLRTLFFKNISNGCFCGFQNTSLRLLLVDIFCSKSG